MQEQNDGNLNVVLGDDLRSSNLLPFASGAVDQIPFYESEIPLTSTCDDDKSNNNPTYDNLVIKVIPAKEIYGPHNKKFEDENVYKNESTPRGYVFLANTSVFNNGSHPERVGSEKDVKNLKSLFNQMGYIVEEHPNLSKGGLYSALLKFSEDKRLNEVDSCFVVVMSHGSDSNGIFTSDNLTVTEDEIISYFNNSNCPALINKPKIFIFQSCRGDMFDVGVVNPEPRNESSSNLVPGSNSTDGSTKGTVKDFTRLPTISDIICIHATPKDFVAYRNEDLGSWLIQALCAAFMENAHNTHIEALIKLASEKLTSDFSSPEGRKQQMQWISTGFNKTFYLNPRPLQELLVIRQSDEGNQEHPEFGNSEENLSSLNRQLMVNETEVTSLVEQLSFSDVTEVTSLPKQLPVSEETEIRKKEKEEVLKNISNVEKYLKINDLEEQIDALSGIKEAVKGKENKKERSRIFR